MKPVLRSIFLILCFSFFFGLDAFPQTKQDTLKQWSVGIIFSPGFYFYRQFPDTENKGLPIQNTSGYPLDKCSKGGSISKGFTITYKQNRRINFQLSILNTKESMKDLGFNIKPDHFIGPDETRIYKYELNFFESYFKFIYNYSVKKKINVFGSIGLNAGFLYKEYIERNLLDTNKFIGSNDIFKFNRIAPEFETGILFCPHKSISYSLSGNINFLPIYQKRNTYESTNGVKLYLNAGVQYNF